MDSYAQFHQAIMFPEMFSLRHNLPIVIFVTESIKRFIIFTGDIISGIKQDIIVFILYKGMNCKIEHACVIFTLETTTFFTCQDQQCPETVYGLCDYS